jgi:putative DNA primase/helicase
VRIVPETGLIPAAQAFERRGSPASQSEAKLVKFPPTGDLSEDACALVFVEQYRETLRYDHDCKSWHVWDNQRWARDDTARAFNFARSVIRKAAVEKPASERRTAGRAAYAAGVERFAQSDERVAVRSDIWDRDPYLLGTPSGTVDLKTGRLVQARPQDFITRSTTAAPADASSSCPIWLKFLTEATAHDPELLQYLQRFAGYCLTGETSEHILLFIYGDGGTGKTTFVNTLLRLLGDYAVQAAMETFTSRPIDRHPEELASLAGSRLVVASETEEGRKWSEARVKQLTGGDPIRARFMRQNSFQFQPTFKLLFCGNHAPHISNLDEAMRRRFNIVPFETKPQDPDPNLEQKLEAEWPGILRWAIEGCLDWQRQGLNRPAAVTSATADYFSGQDTFTAWLEECCEIQRANDWQRVSFAEAFTSWVSYAKQAGEEPGPRKSFGDRMRRKGFMSEQIKAFNGKGFKGISLRRHQTYGGDL